MNTLSRVEQPKSSDHVGGQTYGRIAKGGLGEYLGRAALAQVVSSHAVFLSSIFSFDVLV